MFLVHRLRGFRLGPLVIAGLMLTLLSACASRQRLTAPPVEDRSSRSAAAAAALVAPGTPVAPATAPAILPSDNSGRPLPGAENAGKPGYYTVKPGDTLIRIGLETGQNWRDIARWNGMENASAIEVGQVLRVVSPNIDAGTAVATKGVTTTRIEPRPLDVKPATGMTAASGPTAPTPSTVAPVAAPGAATPTATPAPTTTPAATPTAREPDDMNWAWPASGPVLGGYDEVRSKGLSIGGKAGDPVLAAAEGRVVYAGSGLRGYGNLVIIKHNTTYLTAYAHNQTLLVKEDQQVKRGQKIAEMGSTDAERVQLHFEIRKLGKPVDPARLLPPR